MKPLRSFLAVILTFLLTTLPLAAQTVLPQIGGGQTGMSNAPMKHADVTFDGQRVRVDVDNSIATPTLRPLHEPFEFDSEQPWAVLEGTSYNFQYGWNPGGFISLPENTWIWVELLDTTAGLDVYQRPPALPSYEQILHSPGSTWKWPGSMTHNVYAVSHPQQDSFEATYRVYIGDEQSGTERLDDQSQPIYGSEVVTFQFNIELIGDFDGSGFLDGPDIDELSQRIRDLDFALDFDLDGDQVLSTTDRTVWVEELVGTQLGDADLNGRVEFADFLRLAESFGSESGWADGDFDGDGVVQFSDFLALGQNFGEDGGIVVPIPEPAARELMLVLALGLLCGRRRITA